ncbi:MAG: 2-phosphosulfolactate phosphatase [Leadbetterella sp.]
MSSQNQNQVLQICLSPELLHLYNVKDHLCVVIDIFRATSCMVAGLANGIQSIRPVAELEECKAWQEKGYVGAAERNAQLVEGFELDNSPFSYMNPKYKGKRVCATTTNGTLSISKVKNDAYKVIVGSFLNLGAVADFIRKEGRNVTLVCAGWKGTPCLEDTLFAGNLAYLCKDSFEMSGDSTQMGIRMFEQSQGKLLSYLEGAAHRKRLGSMGIEKDIEYCLTTDVYSIIPVLVEDELVLL